MNNIQKVLIPILCYYLILISVYSKLILSAYKFKCAINS